MTEKRVLVVDDDDAIRALLFTILRRRGFKVDTARNGEEAMERCAACRYAVMLLDMMMPRVSGHDVLAAMERLPPEERPVIIVLTAGVEPRDLSPNIVAGALRKPFDVELLLETITACLAVSAEREQRKSCPPARSEVLPHKTKTTGEEKAN